MSELDLGSQTGRRWVAAGGQLLLTPRGRFCPARDCPRSLCVGDCSCKPCRCGCRGRRARGLIAAPVPDLSGLTTAQHIQIPLFPPTS